ncbi:MAG: 5'-nucleotidase C-terminal domain-containing protein [Immundisolibacterales bacterium]|nr:5'-nucleotidase C-terminal domain-containing protein [Immundisolibacterales bacterium]
MKTLRTSFMRLLAGALLAVSAGVSAEPTTITFLHVNDVYEISPKRGQGGFAPLMTLLARERAASSHTVTTFGGDLFSPSVMSGLTQGAQMVEMMNAIGTDIAVVGNHEYDFGPEVAARNFAASTFPWLGTNVRGADGMPAAGLVERRIFERGGFRIGFFGVITPETDVLSSPGGGIAFAPVVETARKAVEDLKADGAELIVALTHLGIAEDRELAATVEGIHLVLGGHDHVPIAFHEGGVPIFKAGYDAHYLGVVDLRVERVERRGRKSLAVLPEWRLIATAGVAPDPDVQALVDKYEARLDEELGVVIGRTAVEIDSRRASVRSGETNLGNLIAEAMRRGVGAEIGLTNGGGIRGDRTYAQGTELTRKDILTELPFGNTVVLMELAGADLRAALENGVSRIEDGAGRFPQVAGLTFVYDPGAPAGSRVAEVQVGGAPLDPARAYTVATNDYMAGGGDGYASLGNGRQLIDASGATLMATMVMDYIEARGEVAPETDGRISTR